MAPSNVFIPPRQRGLIAHSAAAALLALLSAGCLVVGLAQEVGGNFIVLLTLSLVFFVPLPLFLYRTYSLLRATYAVERDGLRLRWGLRAEDIPLPEIEWVRPASELGYSLPLPLLHWPGAIRGVVNVRDLGAVEFMASDVRTLLLVATPARIFAISPEDQGGFLKAFRRTIEMGSLQPLPSLSIQPTAYLVRIWRDEAARVMLIAGLVVVLMLFVSVSLAVPGRQSISLGYSPDGNPLPPVPSSQMLLLPVLAAFCYTTDLVAGLFFYRRSNWQPIAYLLWGSGVAAPVLLLVAAFLLL
jgi:hypothetical protein